MCTAAVLHVYCCCTAAVLQDVIWWALYKAEAVLLGSWLRKKALDEVGVDSGSAIVCLDLILCVFWGMKVFSPAVDTCSCTCVIVLQDNPLHGFWAC